MSLRPVDLEEVSAATAEVALAAFPKGCMAMRLRDELGVLFEEKDFAEAFSVRGRPALSPVRLALVSILQFAEGLSDRQAANAVRARIDWKYALGLELTDPGFDYSVLCEFRARLIDNGLEQRLLDAVLERAASAGLLRTGGRQRTDSTHVLAAIRGLNRLELAAETLRAALNAVAKTAPAWLLQHMPAEWFDRYCVRAEDYRLPKLRAARIELAHQVGADGARLLASITQTARWLDDLVEISALRDVWAQQYELIDGQTRWRHPRELPPALERVTSPYDVESRTGTKRDQSWDGYKVHLTETCDTNAPHLLTHVATTQAAVTDYEMTSQIHAGLADRELLPATHLLDAGYVTAHHLVTARRDHDVELVGPVKADTNWQKKTAEGGFTQQDFTVDWENQHVTCPNGRLSTRWRNDRSQAGLPVVRAQFSAADCRPCPVRSKCTRAPDKAGRSITLRPQAEHQALQAARTAQQTKEWKDQYACRQGIEGTISQGVRGFGLRRSRYRGLAKTHLQHLLTASAMNLVRIDAWLNNTPLAPTRTSHLAALRPAG